jgi:peptide/nickel transport system permease protein
MFPITGYDASWTGRWQYLILPMIIWIVVSIGSDILLYRTIVLDEIFQDYVRTARAKGLTETVVMLKHVLKNAMIPIITNIVLEIPFLYTGSLLLEAFFGIPGLGGMTVQALYNSDFPVIKDQARGYWLDFKGMNQDMKHVTGEWVAREVFF